MKVKTISSVGSRGRGIVLVIVGLFALLSPAHAGERATRVLSIGFTVSDLDRSVQFFPEVLQFKLERTFNNGVVNTNGTWSCASKSDCMRVARLSLGQELIELTQYVGSGGAPFPPDTRANDRWFQHMAIVVSDMQRAYGVLRDHGVRFASSWPQKLPQTLPNAAGIEAFYFRDPDGHFLELIHFPPDKGDPKWQAAASTLFLGVDHTAIVVSDTEKSRAFYESLGMHVAGTSDNYGYEQEHLNGIFGAHLLITSMRGESGPGVEFLQYLYPTDGRPIPYNLKPSDAAYWQTKLDTGEPIARSQKVVRDPDGHALAIAQNATDGKH